MGKTQTKTQTKKDVEKVELTEDKKIDLQVIKRNGTKHRIRKGYYINT